MVTIVKKFLLNMKYRGLLPARYWVAILSLAGFSLNYVLRTSINLTVVTMVKSHPDTSTDIQNECGFDTSGIHKDYEGSFEWNEWIQGLITGSFYWGYTVGQIPGGRLSDSYGAKKVLGIGTTIAAILSLLIPFAARTHYSMVICIRVVMGLALSPSFPATQTIISKWSPPEERARIATLIYSGMQLGPISGYLFTALILHYLGWEYVFYLQCIITMCWCIIWFLVMADEPKDFKWITDFEEKYIYNAIGAVNRSSKLQKVPWKMILTSVPVWAVIAGSVGHSWGYYTLLTDLPLYMKSMMMMDIKSNALMTAFPYIGQLGMGIVVGITADKLLSNKKFTKTTIRKMAQLFCQLTPAVCLVSLQLVECNKVWTAIIIFFAILFNGGYSAGYIATAIDIAPNWAGTVYGVMNTFNGMGGLFAPMLVGALTNNNQTFSQWRKVFWITSAIYLVESIIFYKFATTDEQPWNQPQQHQREEHEDTIEELKQITTNEEK